MRSIIRRTLIAAATLAVALNVTRQPLLAQSADSTTFRAGQWGAEFALGTYTSAGLMRFSSPTRAWIGTVRGELQETDNESDPPLATGVTGNRSLNVQLGRRFFRPVNEDVLQHFTVGALAGVTRTEQQFGGESATNNNGGGGVFADLGALWMVTRSLSLGAAWNVSATVSRENNNSPMTEQKRTVTRLSLGGVSIRGALYF